MTLTIPHDVRAAMAPTAAALEPYDPAFSPVEVNLSANENAHGLPPAVRSAAAQELERTLYAVHRYPVPLADELCRVLADWHGVAPEQVGVGNGGDELLFNLFLAFGGPGHVLVNCPPTFSVYRLYAELVGTTVVDVMRDAATFAVDVDALVTAARQAHLVIITSPNNPTGTVTQKEAVAAVCEACPGVVLLDEAYGEFAPASSSAVSLLGTHPNLVVLHTLSKAYALAGARLGYVLASQGVVAALAAVRQPYSVNALTQAVALAAVQRRDAFAPAIEALRAERERLLGELAGMGGLGVVAYPSEANFVLVRVPQAQRTWERLRDEHSVLVRSFARTPGLEGCLRVTVGTREENDRLMAGLRAVLAT